MAEDFDELYSAVRKLFADKGGGFCFPPDKLWEYADPSKWDRTPQSIIGLLKKESYIVPTGGTAKSVTVARKGAPVTEYTFGAEVAPNSLAIATASKAGSSTASTISETLQASSIPENENGVFPLSLPLQRIIYGCPGSGKSYQLGKDAEQAHFTIRTVFFQETRAILSC